MNHALRQPIRPCTQHIIGVSMRIANVQNDRHIQLPGKL